MTTKSAIIVHHEFELVWPWVADHFHELWQNQAAVEFIRLPPKKQANQVHQLLDNPQDITRLVCLLPSEGNDAFFKESLDEMPNLNQVFFVGLKDTYIKKLEEMGIRLITHNSVEYWGQSVSEFAFALTLCGLRRIPQTHHHIITSLDEWNYSSPDGIGRPGQRGGQYGDDSSFSNGTLEGKRVRIVGAGNIGSRYASFCHFFGASVSMWDPFASDPCFHRAGAHRECFLEQLMPDSEIFAPMLPLTPETEGIIGGEHIEALPKGCLVVMVTRAAICNCEVLYRRVLNDELALAADVFDHEPLEIGHSLLGRHNVIHTPHNAGRTKEANWRYAEMLADQFSPVR